MRRMLLTITAMLLELVPGLRLCAADYTQFLKTGQFRVTQQNAVARIFPGGKNEEYLAEIKSGNQFMLSIKDPLLSYAEVE